MRPLAITRDLQIALAIYTIGVERSRRAYHREQDRAQAPLAVKRAYDQQRYRDRKKK